MPRNKIQTPNNTQSSNMGKIEQTQRSLFDPWNLRFVWLSFLGTWLLPMIASAHEVYVLDEAAIEAAMATTSPDPFSAYFGNEYQFFFWGLVSFVAVSTILAASAFRLFEPTIGPLLMRLKRYARFIVRLTAGATPPTFGYYWVLYGPELPLPEIFGAWTPTVQALLICFGIALILGA